MNFELSDRQKHFQWAVLEFAKGEFDQQLAIELDQSGTYPEPLLKKASNLRLIGVHYPKEFGGLGLGLFDTILIIEALCRVDSGIGSALSAADLGSEIILKFGSDGQKRNLLPSLARGEKKLTLAFVESERPKDVTAVSTVAERRDKEYLIHGEKRFVTNVDLADTFLVLCKEPKEGWIMLSVERGNERIEVRPIKKMGLKMISFGDLLIKGVRVSSEGRIGEEGEGMAQVRYFDQIMGLRSAAQGLGISQGAFDRAVQYAGQRKQFGRKLGQFQVIRHKLADMVVGIEVARWLTYKSAADFDQGSADPKMIAATRLEVRRRLLRVVDEAIQIFGGYGYMAEHGIEHYYRDAWAVAVSLGTEKDQLDTIAEELIGT